MVYKPITKDDIGRIIDLTMQHLTYGNYIAEEISRSAEKGNYYGVIALEDGEVVGFNAVKRGIEFTLPHLELEAEIAKLVPDELVFNGDTLYVDSRYRRRGIGREMTLIARDQILALGGRYFLGELWVYPDGSIPASSSNQCYGETVLERLVPLFYRDLPRYGMCCPICGEDCRCGAVVRLTRLKGEIE